MTIEVLTTLIMAHAAPGAVQPQELATAILQESSAQGVDARLVARIMLQESRGKANAYNRRSRDSGLMQINEKTAQGANISSACLQNWRCNLRQGVKLLAKANRPCAYNLGNAGSKKWPKSCIKYELKLASFN